jgi:hypothetical protein
LKATEPFRIDEQLLVCFGGPNKGRKALKATISRWVCTAIELAYQSLGKALPEGIKAHQTCAVSASWAEFHNVSLTDICDTASWGNESTFVKHYQLNLSGNKPTVRLGNVVLQTVLSVSPQ